MHVLVIYDITNDRARSKIAIICEDYGLDRIQYSAYYGHLSRNLQEELMLKVKKVLGDNEGHVQLMPIGTVDWEKRLEVKNHAG